MPRVASVTDVIDVGDFPTVWNFLETKFSFSTQWRFEWQQYIDQQARQNPDAHPVLDFLAFGCRNVEPLLNAVLCRNQYYATFSRMVFWLVRDRLVGQGWIRFSENETF